MKITFHGTRGYIEVSNRRHRMHSVLQVSHKGACLMIDWGQDWLGRGSLLEGVEALFITHGHPDHAWGLADGSPCPVYATSPTLELLGMYPVKEKCEVKPREPVGVGGVRVEAFSVEHSTRAPAVGYRLTGGRTSLFYAPDLVYIRERAQALGGCIVYIGYGASVTRPLVRKRDENLIGHTPLRTKLIWCGKEGVPRAFFTHCGTAIVSADERTLRARVNAMAKERGVEARIAFDGLEEVLRS
jgi:phosphoribosyl 1,2-cyclic phosphodiesterase